MHRLSARRLISPFWKNKKKSAVNGQRWRDGDDPSHDVVTIVSSACADGQTPTQIIGEITPSTGGWIAYTRSILFGMFLVGAWLNNCLLRRRRRWFSFAWFLSCETSSLAHMLWIPFISKAATNTSLSIWLRHLNYSLMKYTFLYNLRAIWKRRCLYNETIEEAQHVAKFAGGCFPLKYFNFC